MLLRNPGRDIAVAVGERVRRAVAALDLRRIGVPGVSVSVGVAVAEDEAMALEVVIDEADRALYRANGPAATGWWPRRGAGGAVGARGREPGPYHAGVTTTNDDLARIFHEIGDILEVKGELSSRPSPITAPRTPSPSAVRRRAAYAAGDRRPIPGSARPSATRSWSWRPPATSHFHDRLRAEVPPGVVDLLRIPGVGPKTVRLVWEDLGIDSMEDLRRAAEAGELRGLKGISAGTEQRILEGIALLASRPQRLLLDSAQAISEVLVAQLVGAPGVARIVQAGSLRRRRETIGDLDLLVETDDPRGRRRALRPPPGVEGVIGAGRAKASVRLAGGPQVDLMVMPPGEAGTYLVHFTGSTEHNVRLRGIARDRGWSLSEKGFLRLGAGRRARDAAPPPSCGRSGRGRRVRLPRPAVHRARAARGRGRGGGRATRGSCRRWSRLATCGATSTATPTGAMACTRSRHGRGRPPARIRLPGADGPLAGPRDRAGPGAGSRGAAAGDHRRAQRAVRGGGGGGAAAARTPPGASGCSTAASWRSGRTAASTTRTTCSSASTSSSPRSTSPAASPAPAADAAGPRGDPEPARGRHRPPGRPDDPGSRRPRPRLGRGLRGRGRRRGRRWR